MPFLLTTLSGLSTMIGTILIFIFKRKNNFVILASLSFAAGVMLVASIFDLIPESFSLLSLTFKIFPAILILLIFLNIGIIISFTINKYLPDTSNDELYRVGVVSMLAIIIHNIPEGIATFMAGCSDSKLGITLTLAIALHNIPEGISIAVPIYHSSNNKLKAFLYALLSGMSEVLGSILAYLFLAPLINDHVMAALYAIIAGIMIHISVYELIPGAYKEGTLKSVLKYFLIGFGVMVLSHLLMSL